MNDPVIAFLGAGNMGRSLAGGLIADGVPPARLRAADPSPDQRERLRRDLGVDATADGPAAVRGAGIVVLAVKPQVMREAVQSVAEELREARPLVLSVAAGVRIGTLRAWLEADLPVVRAMPNTPALIGAGCAALYAGPGVTPSLQEQAEKILRAVGSVIWLEDEALMDVVTALSGSGPAYYFLLMEALEAAAADLGLPLEKARLLSQETALGAARMALESPLQPVELRRQVTSPGGTTERALEVLEGADFRGLVARAVTAARNRSVELAKTLKEE